MIGKSACVTIVMAFLMGLGMAPRSWAEDAPGGRYALLIGNSQYGAEIVSGVADAKEMKEYLEQIDFTVLPLVLDGSLKDMRDGLAALKLRISQASVVVVFYSGHGFQANNTNFLLPVGVTPASTGSLPLGEISTTLVAAPNAVKFVFLDACRDLKNLSSGLRKGLAEIPDPPRRVVYAFAAGAGATAKSGNANTAQKLSPYTDALLRYIREPGLEIRDFLARVHADVAFHTGGSQAPTEFGLSHLGEERFFLRDPVFVKAEIEQADNAMIVFLNGEIVRQKSGDQKVEGDQNGEEKLPLPLKAGSNELILYVFNEKTFRNHQSWERAEGWSYRFKVFRANGPPLDCTEEKTAADGCFSDREEDPFKAGPRHGKLFQVAKVNLHVDPVTAELTLLDPDDKIWERETEVWARNQGELYGEKVVDMRLEDILGPGNATLVRFALSFIAIDPEQVYFTVRGNLHAKEATKRCWDEHEEKWIREIRAGIERAFDHDPKPFKPFDDGLAQCIKVKAREAPHPDLPPDEIKIWTAIESRHRDTDTGSPSGIIAAGGLPRPNLMVGAERSFLTALTEQFPSIDPAQHQLAAVQAAREQLQRLRDKPLLYASLSAADLQAHLPKDLEARFNLFRMPGVARVSRVELRDQEVVVRAAFKVARPDIRVRLSGEVEIHCAVAVERGALVLRPSVETIHLMDAWIAGRDVNLEEAKRSFGQLLKGLLDDVSQTLGIRRVPLRLGGIERIDLAGLLGGVGSLANIDAQPVDINVALGAAALLIDAEGIHVLADAVVLTPKLFAATVEELRQDLELSRTPQLTSPKLAVLGECGEPLALPEPLSLTFAAVCTSFASLTHFEPPVPAGSPEGAETALASELDVFQNDFRDRAFDVEPRDRLPWNRTVVAFSRSQLAGGLNEVLRGVAVQATFQPPSFRAEIPPENRTIRTPRAPELHCDRVGGDCPSTFVFAEPDFTPEPCKSDCIVWKTILGARIPTVDLECQAEKISCEAQNEAGRIAREARKTAAQIEFDLKKVACEAVKEGEQLGCQVNQDWLKRFQGEEVAELQVDLELRDVDLLMKLDQVRIGAGLEAADLHLFASGGGEASGRLQVTPLELGRVVCNAPWEAALGARVILPGQQRTLNLQKLSATTGENGLLITFKLSEIPLQIKLDPPPIKTFLEQNAGQLALSCPLPDTVLTRLAGFPGVGFVLPLVLGDEILRDTFDVSIPAQEIPLLIPNQEIQISEGQSIRLVPSWGEKAILFEAR